MIPRPMRLIAFILLLLMASTARSADLYRIRFSGNDLAYARVSGSFRTVLTLRGQFADALLTPEDVVMLRKKGFHLEFVQNDPEAYMRYIASRADLGVYHGYEEMKAKLKRLALLHPDRIQVVDFGDSWEKTAGVADRDLWAVGISAPGAAKSLAPVALFLGGVHAREIATTEVLLDLIDSLVADTPEGRELRRVLETTQIWVVPLLNPDGREYALKTDPWWRKNRRRFPSESSVGVDLNRNFPFFWSSGVGSSERRESAVYRGEGPLSEPEAMAFSKLVAKLSPVTSLSFHAYGKYILTPYGYPARRTGDQHVYDRVTRELSERTGYPAGTVGDLLGYHSSGRHDDWLHGMQGVISLEMELGRTFFPRLGELRSLSRLALQSCLYMARLAGRWFRADVKRRHDGMVSLEGTEVETGDRSAFVAELRIGNHGLAGSGPIHWSLQTEEDGVDLEPRDGTLTGLTGIRDRRSESRMDLRLELPEGRDPLVPLSLTLKLTTDGQEEILPMELDLGFVPGE